MYLNDQTTGGISDNTDVGVVRFTGDEKDGGTKETYAEIRGVAHDPGQGSSNKGNLSFFVQAAGDLNETLTLDEAKVGINQAAPSAALHITGSGDTKIIIEDGSDEQSITAHSGGLNYGVVAGDTHTFVVDGADKAGINANGMGIGNVAGPGGMHAGVQRLVVGDGAGNEGMAIWSGADSSGMIGFARANDGNTDAYDGNIEYEQSGRSMRFALNAGAERARFLSAGNFLVGATAAIDGEQMLVNRNGSCKMTVRAEEDSSARDALFSLHTRNTGAQCRINFVDGAGAGTGSGQIYYNHDGNSMRFLTDATEQFIIDGSGNLTATDTDGIGAISDRRLKTNIKDYTYSIDNFKSYTPRIFDWINPEEHGNKSQQLGFVAQEQESVDNRFVYESETSPNRKDTKLIDTITKEDGDVVGISKTSKFGQKDAMYISVIQQLITRLETAEEKIAALEGGN